jgi:hypothetical protein
LHYVQGEKKDWKSFFAGIPDDLPRTEVIDQIMAEEHNGRQIVFVSARPEDYREATEAWFERAFKGYRPYLALIMRESGDKRPDVEVKRDILNNYLKHLDIVRVYDDRPSVIRMWRDNELEVMDMGAGVEF